MLDRSQNGWRLFFLTNKSMKKLLSIVALCLFTVALCAQDRVVTKFLGIPVDGTKTEMISKLKAKGFKSIRYSDMLKGEFNGNDVYISIVTNNNKVCRVGVIDQRGVGKTNIKIKFNNLCKQFEHSGKYMTLFPNFQLSDDEDISYGITVNDKRYEAIFYQKDDAETDESTGILMRPVWFNINELHGEYRIMILYENLYNQADGEDL